MARSVLLTREWDFESETMSSRGAMWKISVQWLKECWTKSRLEVPFVTLGEENGTTVSALRDEIEKGPPESDEDID